MGASVQPVPATPDPADLWDYLVGKGLSEADATRHVMRVLQNTPAQVRHQYLKDVDPGLLASFGLGAADMMSFGLGDQAAKALWGQEATDTQQAAEAIHPTAHFAGEAAGLAIPLLGERVLARAGVKLAPTAIGAAVRGIESRVGRAAAKTALRAVEGAGYAGAQAAGRTEGSIPERLRAAGRVAPIGAAVGALLPLGIAGVKATAGPTASRFLDALAGKGSPQASGLLATEAAPSATEALRAQLLKAGVLPENLEAQMARQATPRAGLLTADPLEQPAFLRSQAPVPEPRPSPMAKGQPGAALPRAWQEMTPQAGGVGGHSYSGTYPRPDPAPIVTNALKAQATLRGMSIADLQRAWSAPQVPKALRALIEAEFQRRMVTLPSGLLAAPIR